MIEDYDQAIASDIHGKWSPVDDVRHPKHYTSHPSGVECITITRHMNFCLGNAMKYIWRADLKENAIQDLEKAKWYIEQELELRRGNNGEQDTTTTATTKTTAWY